MSSRWSPYARLIVMRLAQMYQASRDGSVLRATIDRIKPTLLEHLGLKHFGTNPLAFLVTNPKLTDTELGKAEATRIAAVAGLQCVVVGLVGTGLIIIGSSVL